MRTARGFTLVELVVVLLVLGLGVALALPSVGRSAEALRARAEVAAVTAFLRQAREQAVVRRQTHEVRTDAEGRVLLLLPGADGPGPSAVARAAGAGDGRAARRLADGVRLVNERGLPPAVRFSAEGSPQGSLAWRLQGPGRRSALIAVDPLTGRVHSRPGDV